MMSEEIKHVMEHQKMLNVIGKRIANIRKMRKMNQADLGETAGRMLNTISNIERGIGDPKITTLHAIAHALRVPVAELLIYKHPIVDDEDKQIYAETTQELRKLDSAQMKMVRDIIKTINDSSKEQMT